MNPRSHFGRGRGFTLVEMLVVLGIIAVLAALLLPAAMGAITKARDAAIGIEVNQLASAIEAYKQEKGDYPPNFRNMQTVIQHIRKCYPKIAQTEFDWFFQYTSGSITDFKPNRQMDEGESLVFWLSHTTTDPRYCFGFTNPSAVSVTFKKYYEFDDSRLESLDTEPAQLTGEQQVRLPSYHAKHCKDSFYIYIDSRSYMPLTVDCEVTPKPTNQTYAYAEDSSDGIRPYWSETVINQAASAVRMQNKPMNATTFQIICAGQDGVFGVNEPDAESMIHPKIFARGDYYSDADKDNITNFSGGRRLEASAGKSK